MTEWYKVSVSIGIKPDIESRSVVEGAASRRR
jgi:hypothetical protein